MQRFRLCFYLKIWYTGIFLEDDYIFFEIFKFFSFFFKERNERQLPCNTDSQFYLKCLQLSETSSHIYTDKGQFSEKTKQNKFHSIRKLACSSGNMVSMLSNFF